MLTNSDDNVTLSTMAPDEMLAERKLQLAIDIADEALNNYEKRFAAAGTSLGGVLSIAVLTVIGLFAGVSGYLIAGLIIATQSFRTLWLWYKAYYVGQECERLQREVLDSRLYRARVLELETDALIEGQPPQ